jgi:phage FluMu gp28-like protein
MKYTVGCDLGQQADYTALYVAEKVSDSPLELHVVHLERFRGVLYPEDAERVGRLMDSPELRGAADLVIDATGVGPAVTDIFTQRGRRFTSVKIHGGDAVSNPSPGEYRVPKRDLISGLQVLLQSGRLKIAGGLEHAETLRQELLNFRIKVNVATGHDSYEAWREGDHDDLVLAAAMAAWKAQYKVPKPRIRLIQL